MRRRGGQEMEVRGGEMEMEVTLMAAHLSEVILVGEVRPVASHLVVA